MNKVPQFQDFTKHDPTEQQKWFQNIIQQFYENNKFKLLSVQEVQQLNRDTLSYMIRELKNMKFNTISPIFSNIGSTQYDRFDEPTVFSDRPYLPSNSEKKSVTRDYLLQKKQEEINRQFSDRQKEYSFMLKKGPDTEIDFRLPMDNDEPIDNIEELIKNQARQRNIEYPVQPTTIVKSVEPNNEPFLPFSESQASVPTTSDESPISISLEEINYNPPRRSEQFPFRDISGDPPKKNVKWSETLEVNSQIHHPPNYSMKEKEKRNEEFNLIKEFMIEMKDIVQDLRRDMEEVKKNMSVQKNTSTPFASRLPNIGIEPLTLQNAHFIANDFYGNLDDNKPTLVIHSDKSNDSFELQCDEL
jgi:hypothetical protein